MTGWYEVAGDRRHGLIRLTMGGFFDAAGVAAMHHAVLDAVRRLPCAPGEHVTLCDITAMNIQSQDVVASFTSVVGASDIRSRRLAFVTGATLARLQARRLTSRDGVAFFDDRDAAMAWLIDDAAGQDRAAA